MMMTIDLYTILAGGVLLLLALLTPMCSAFFRRPVVAETDDDGREKLPTFSIVMTAHDNARELERNLPQFLSQQYAADYEVIVVDESSTDDTDDVLTQLKAAHPNLYTTYIPDSSHYLSRRKLALTLGIKAAKNEWLILTDISCRPEGDGWLTAMGRQATSDNDMVLGYTGYEDAPLYWRFDRLQTMCYQLKKALTGTAYRYEGHNLAMRRSTFMANNGFLNNLKYLRGEYDMTVNEYATPGRTAIANEPAARMHQERPSKKEWTYSHLYYIESRKHMKRGFTWRLQHNVDQWALHLNYIAELAAGAWAAVTQNWLLLAAAFVALVLTLALRTLWVKKAAADYDQHMPLLTVPFLELRYVWQQLAFLLRYRLADPYDFIRR